MYLNKKKIMKCKAFLIIHTPKNEVSSLYERRSLKKELNRKKER